MSSFALRPCFAVIAASLILACGRPSQDVTPSEVAPAQVGMISDQVHNHGVPGFFWLPPMVKRVHHVPYGEFVPGLAPVVTVERLPLGSQPPVAVFTTTSGRHHRGRVTSDGRSRYMVRWDTRHDHLDPAATYRIRVELGGFELGFADLDVVEHLHHEHHTHHVDRDEYVPVVDDRVLPIAFRIEKDALRCVGVVCAPADQCHVGKCDPFTGSCTSPAKPDGAICDDGDACTRADACRAGVCAGADPVTCQASDQCHVPGTCDPATGTCSDPVATDGTWCDDGDACSQADGCVGGACVGADLVVCTSRDQCHDAGVCDAATGVCSDPAKIDGTPCSDGDYCTTALAGNTVADACVAGACKSTPVVCDDGDPCTQNLCDHTAPGLDGVTGCVFVPDKSLPGCPTPPPAPTVSIAGLTPATSGFFVNQRLSFSVRLMATAERADYDVEFLLYPVTSTGDAPAVAVGTTHVAPVTSGATEHWVELELPKSLSPGRWGLLAHEYPTSEVFYPGQGDPPVEFDVQAAPGRPVLDITALEVAQAAVLVDSNSTVVSEDPSIYRDTPFAANLQLVAQNYPAAAVPVTARLMWNETVVPLKLWDPAQQRWVSSLVVGTLEADAPTGLYLEAALTEADAALIRGQLGTGPADAAVVVAVNESGGVGEAECVVDNPAAPVNCRHSAQVAALVYAAPPPSAAAPHLLAAAEGGPTGNTRPLRYEKSWSKHLGNTWVGVGLSFLGYAQLSKDGYEASARGTVPVSLLGFPEFNFIDAEARADALVASTAHVAVTVKILGFNVYDPVSLAGNQLEKDLGDLVELPKIEKEKSYATTVWIAIVPVTFKLGASAEIGLEGTITASLVIGDTPTTDVAELSLGGGPYAKAEGFGEGAVGVAFLSAGARVTLVIIDAHLTATATGTLTLTKRADTGLPVEIQGGLSEKLTYSSSFLNGRVGLTATYPALKWCKVWFVWLPCGVTVNTAEKTLCSWPGFAYGGDILKMEQSLFTIDLCTPTKSCAGACETTIDNGCRLENCACGADQTCSAGVCVQKEFPFPGLYYTELRWGAAAGLWRDESLDGRAEPLDVSVDRRAFMGEVRVNNAVITDNRVTWTMAGGNNSNGDILFLDGSSNTYIWGAGGRQGILFEGYIQFPGEGPLDYRGVRMCVPTLTCAERCGPLFDGCAIIDCGDCRTSGAPTRASSELAALP